MTFVQSLDRNYSLDVNEQISYTVSKMCFKKDDENLSCKKHLPDCFQEHIYKKSLSWVDIMR